MSRGRADELVAPTRAEERAPARPAPRSARRQLTRRSCAGAGSGSGACSGDGSRRGAGFCSSPPRLDRGRLRGGYAVSTKTAAETAGPECPKTLELTGTRGAERAGDARGLEAEAGNWPMTLNVTGLPAAAARYTTSIVRDGKPWALWSVPRHELLPRTTLTLNAPHKSQGDSGRDRRRSSASWHHGDVARDCLAEALLIHPAQAVAPSPLAAVTERIGVRATTPRPGPRVRPADASWPTTSGRERGARPFAPQGGDGRRTRALPASLRETRDPFGTTRSASTSLPVFVARSGSAPIVVQRFRCATRRRRTVLRPGARGCAAGRRKPGAYTFETVSPELAGVDRDVSPSTDGVPAYEGLEGGRRARGRAACCRSARTPSSTGR